VAGEALTPQVLDLDVGEDAHGFLLWRMRDHRLG
jgi:hypothetical protein